MSAGESIGEALAAAELALRARLDSSRADAEILLAHVRARPRHEPYSFPERALDDDQRERYAALVARRLAGEPVAYLVGTREFWSLALEVTPATLIPRPDTERLVEIALHEIAERRAPVVADLGTGSGAIALAIAKQRPDARVIATDCSAEALAVAQSNAARLAIGNVEFRHGNWCEPLAATEFELIVSNPPYIEQDDPHLRTGDLRYEPQLALDGGADGLSALAAIAQAAHANLKAGAKLVLEHGYDQQDRVLALLEAAGYENPEGFTDYAGLPRVCAAARCTPSA